MHTVKPTINEKFPKEKKDHNYYNKERSNKLITGSVRTAWNRAYNDNDNDTDNRNIIFGCKKAANSVFLQWAATLNECGCVRRIICV